MVDKYRLVFVTHIPVFYKVNLYNAINKNKKIFVIFVASETVSKRSDDFLTLKEAEFSYEVLSDVEFENRDRFKNIIKLQKILSKVSFERIIVSGWDLLEFWYVVFTNQKKKNAMALESTIYESQTTGLKGFIKKVFLSRISKVFASGSLHKALLDSLDFKGEVAITKGVGIIRKPSITLQRNASIKNRIVYVGRLSPEKNLDLVINLVNDLPWLQLDIYGVGPQEQELKHLAQKNIVFHGSIPNSKLEEAFVKADFFILPSKSETWGLVVEEALYFGLPVIVSDRCGASELIDNNINGIILVFENIKQEISDCLEEKKYRFYRLQSKNLINEKKDIDQVVCYQ
jgi:glycosyltransferase involved in cell wall biosynthesis